MNISNKAKQHADSCRFCWMCRHVCPIGNADGQERNNARARALLVSLVSRNTEKLEDIAENMYECALCGACTNNCKTGWDPKIFIQEVRNEIVLNGCTPTYINSLLENYMKKGTIFNHDKIDVYTGNEKGDTLILFGENAVYNEKSTLKAINLLKKAGVNVATNENADQTGYSLWFLTGKTEETVNAAKKSAEEINKFKTVVVYNPVELSTILHQWKEWGIEITAKIYSFNEFLLKLIKNKKLLLKKTSKEYTLQDSYAYSRELDDDQSGRQLIDYVGKNKEMLLNKKEANFAGSLIMDQYMHEKMLLVAKNRWINAINMSCKTLVTTNPDEHILLELTSPKEYKVITIEEMLLENM